MQPTTNLRTASETQNVLQKVHGKDPQEPLSTAKAQRPGPRGKGYPQPIELSLAGRAATPDEIGTIGALLMGADDAFIRALTSSWMAA